MNGTLNDDDRGQTTNSIVKIIVGLAVAGLITAVLLPIGLGAITADSTTTATQASGEEVVIAGDVNGTVTTLDDTAGEVTVDVTDASSGTTSTVTVAEGSTMTATVDGSDVDVTADSVTASSADLTYTYETSTGWGGGASALWGIMDVIIVLGAFLLFVGLALRSTNRI